MLSLFLFALREAEDLSFIGKLYIDYRYLVRSEIKKIYSDKNDIDDLVHDVFIKLIRHEQKLKEIETGKRASYIIKTIHTTVWKFLLKKSKESFIIHIEELEKLADEACTLDKMILRIEEMEQYRPIYDAMKPKERMILKYKFDLEYTDQEIAEELDLSVNSVHVVVNRAKKSFAKLLESQRMREKRLYGESFL